MVTLLCHIGLGDIILLAGAIVRLVERHGKLRIFCYAGHYASVVSFFERTPGIHIVPLHCPPGQYGVPEESALAACLDGGDQVLRSGHYHSEPTQSQSGPTKSFPELFYEQLGIPWSERWTASPINRAASWAKPIESDCQVFVHDDASRRLCISRGIEGKELYRPAEGGGSILRHASAIRSAKEIHVIDSSFYHLVESLSPISAKLYLHRYARAFIPIWNDYPRQHQWNILA
jgi:hypothetical protein